jgi:hypothetical protein
MAQPFFRGDRVEVRIGGAVRGTWVPVTVDRVSQTGRFGGQRWMLLNHVGGGAIANVRESEWDERIRVAS